MAHDTNQEPVEVTTTDLITGEAKVVEVQPVVALDGGDGTRASAATKIADDVWHPFRALEDTSEFVAAPATRTSTAGDNTAVIAAGLAKI